MVNMSPDRGEEAVLTAHDRNTARVAEAVFGLVAKFAPMGMTPAAVLEGSIKGAVIALATYQGDGPEEIADMLDEIAAAVRTMDPDELRAATRPTPQ